jgi:thiamine-monophosphate kinase
MPKVSRSSASVQDENALMGPGEFDLIARYFDRPSPRAALGVGDDCALWSPSAGHHLAMSCDMLVEGRHFLPTVAPERLGHKSLAVNLSDLAACGAKPAAFMLALALPRADEAFLEGFARGLFSLAEAHGCELIGGDTTQGPLNITITVFGEVPNTAVGGPNALLRSGASPGDDIYVSGTIGDARLALEVFRGRISLDAAEFESVRRAMEMPEPRVALGIALRAVASSAIDLSDGLLGDLTHVLERSGVDAVIDADAVPRSAALARQSPTTQRLCALSGGDDYELAFTASPDRAVGVVAASEAAGVRVTRIGRIESRAAAGNVALRVVDRRGNVLHDLPRSFDHFRS